jgi:hypothetical protein
VRAELPGLDVDAARALAVVALAGRTRTEAAAIVDDDGELLAEALARGRKSLRRSMFPLAGSGWCERAERLVSDRLDGALDAKGAARLDVHLRNCPRCVEHERRLVQATDSLTASFEQAYGVPTPAARTEAATPALAVVQPQPGPRVLPFGQPVRPALPAPAEPAPAPATVEQPPATAAFKPKPAAVRRSLPKLPTLAPATTVWGVLLVLAVLVAAASVALAIAGALGASIH